jgi:mannose-6-phosphate isomerase class I
MRKSTYDKLPFIGVPGSGGQAVEGWDEIAGRLRAAVVSRAASVTVLSVECYPGVDVGLVSEALVTRLDPVLMVRAEDAMHGPGKIDALVEPFVGGEDPVFGFLSGLKLPDFFDGGRVQRARAQIEAVRGGLVLVVGVGATLIHPGDLLVYADLARWEAQGRFRRNTSSNLGVANSSAPANQQYKRAFFVDWRVADGWKRPLIRRWDYLLDTHAAGAPKLADGDAVRRGLAQAVTRPFRVVPFFDPAPWGGQWMKEVCDLGRDAVNYGWCFDCVPEENSLLMEIGGIRIEMPSLNVVFDQPRGLLGEAVHARFGDEFPIRFDFLDTMQGGNLSFQVHPLTEYIQRHFGMHYTQDESYYMLDAGPDASVYLGLREGVDGVAMERDLRRAREGGFSFPAERYANRWPAKRHDHFLIPAGTVHCSGANAMVLEISATPYIFTFKMWDWDRLGLDGKPRPIYLDHAMANVDWSATTARVEREMINHVHLLSRGDGWREERTGLHSREFIETRRHWFSGTVHHPDHRGVQVLNLVQGDSAWVESAEGRFEPFLVHYAETFIMPAGAGAYTVCPARPGWGEELATMKAYVRT